MDLHDRLDRALPVVEEHADHTDSEGRFPEESIAALAEAGLLGLTLSTDVGGLGLGPTELVEAVSAVAEACGSTSMIYLMHLSAAAVLAAAPPESAGDTLSRLASGESLGTLAFSEKGSRSHFWAPMSRAAAASEGRLRIAADKSWVTAANHADVWVASCLSAGSDAFTDAELFLLDGQGDGAEVQGRFEGLGLRGNDSAPVKLDVEVPEGARLGAEGAGFGLMMQVVLPWFSLGNSSVSLGLARAAIDRAIAHASGTRFAHVGTTLSELPTIRAYLAKAWSDLSAHQAFLAQTARRVEEPDDGTVLAVLATKAACNEAALRITETALRVTGGAGFSKHVGIDRPYRDARAGFVMAPTSDALYDFSGRALCGMELF
jgi:alkylation response protein AidB-like acyl-CoA dehydrogenase